YARPDQIPWGLQFTLNATRAVGRLDLTVAEGLGRYVRCLIDGWPDDGADGLSAVVWAVDTGDVMTPLMPRPVAEPLHKLVHTPIQKDKACKQPPPPAAGAATVDELVRTLRRRPPGLILTTSPGEIDTPAAAVRRTTLGMPVDQNHSKLGPGALRGRWSPGG